MSLEGACCRLCLTEQRGGRLPVSPVVILCFLLNVIELCVALTIA